MDQPSTHADYAFGGFRLDTVLQVLVSPAGEPIALTGRAYDALLYLVEHAGEVVDKASLMRAVWPTTVVEDNNLNQCILTLRRALGESAGERRFILTVPGRGFKFVAPVRAVPAKRDAPPLEPSPVTADQAPSAPAATAGVTSEATPAATAAVTSEATPAAISVATPEATPAATPAAMSVATPGATPAASASQAPRGRLSRLQWVAVGSSLLVAVFLAVTISFLLRPGPVTVATEYEALTDLSESAMAPALSPDGKMLAFIVGNSAFLATGQVYVKLLPNGEPTPLTKVLEPIYGPAFSFDGTRVAFTYVTKRQGEYSWDTWMVPTTGGQPALFLANAAGLTWVAPHQLIYSEIESGIHMGIVTSADDRAGRRAVYLPSHERGMAHYSYLSPDRQSVLVVEMDRTGEWQRCRLVPFDGRSAGEQVGPAGLCTSAAWSPDGKWMYFSAYVAGHSHLWRQRYPHGEAQQITFGPTEEEGVAVAPDGRSLVTSLGLQQQSIWIHDASGERRITSETVAAAPRLSPDAKRLYFLAASGSETPSSLRRLDIAQGQQEPVLPGFNVVDYDISRDETKVVFSVDHDGEMQIWVAPLDHHLPPRLLARGADEPAFDGSGHVFFRLLGEKVNYLYRMQDDGSSKQRALDTPILEFQSVSPTGKWAAVQAVINGTLATAILGLGGDTFRWTRAGYWSTRWSSDGRTLYLEVGKGIDAPTGRTLPITLAEGKPPQIPPLPPASEQGLLPHATEDIAPGPDPATYAFTRAERLQNIYRIPLHR